MEIVNVKSHFDLTTISDVGSLARVGVERIGLIDLGGGTYSVGSPTVETESLYVGIKTIPPANIYVPSTTITTDTDITLRYQINSDGVWRGDGNGVGDNDLQLDSTATDGKYPIKSGQIAGNISTTTDIKFKLKYNSDGSTYQESGDPVIENVDIAETVIGGSSTSEKPKLSRYGNRRISTK